MESGNIVEFIDGQKIICAVILEIKKLRLRLLTENNREIKLSANRLAYKSNLHLDLSLGRDKLTEALKQVANRRKALIQHVNIQELWEVLNSEQEWIDLPTMTAFCFAEPTTADHESAVMRAFFENRIYFKFNPDRFFPNSAEKVAQLLAQESQAARKQQLIARAAALIHSILTGGKVATVDIPSQIVEILTSFYLLEKDSPHYELGQAILDKAGIDSTEAVFKILVKLGIWTENQNIDLLRFDIPLTFPENVQHSASQLTCRPFADAAVERRDLSHLSLMTIDGQSTLDFDDALSFEDHGDYLVVGIHIADVAHYVRKGDPIDQEAMNRGSSIYTPDQKISMVPGCLSDDLCSLKQGELRPAISTMVKIKPSADIIDFDIFPSLIRVKQQLTYYEVNLTADHDPTIRALSAVAHNFRTKRLEQGAIQITLPEINIWLNGNGTPMISKVNRESPGRMLVAEWMILANWLAARFLAKHRVPAIFRSQPEPRERLFSQTEGSLYQNWMQRKLLSRFVLDNQPANHSGLGLGAYVTATSPIRKYFDLVTQRQIRSVLGLEPPYSETEIDHIIQLVELPMSQVVKVQFRRNRYWLLKYLEGRTGQKEEAIVLGKRRNAYQILLKEYLLECNLPLHGSYELKPEDLIQVTLQRVNARSDVLTVFLG
jgi:exoribonuclease II